jgi:hypothetical protein
LKSHLSLQSLSIAALTLSLLSPISLPKANAKPALVTCVNLISEKERVSRTGECRPGREAQANWHKISSDSAISAGPDLKVITTCSDSEKSSATYRIIRKRCARNQTISNFSRSGALPATPEITEAAGYSHDSAYLSLVRDPAESLDAPIAFYTITATRVSSAAESRIETQRVYFWRDLRLIIRGLQSSTSYILTVTATTVDGTSEVSLSSMPVTTAAYIPPTPTSSSSNAGPASMLTVSRSSAGTSAGVAFSTQPQIAIQDASGNTVTSSSAVVTATISSRGSLVGTTSATASGGVATFNNLGVRGFGGTAYTITYSTAGLTSATEIVTPSAYAIGATGPGGGKIYYIAADANGFQCGQTLGSYCFYLEVAPNNWSGGNDPTVSWAQSDLQSSSSNITLSAGIGLGAQNTKAIIDQGNNNSSTSAAARARSYSVTTSGINFDDWFLPSENELSQMFIQRVAVGVVFAGASYWSSTSTGGLNGRYLIVTHVSATPGSFSGALKGSTYYVRPIRAF